MMLTVSAIRQGAESSAAASTPWAQAPRQRTAVCIVDLKAADGTVLKENILLAARTAGLGCLLFHQKAAKDEQPNADLEQVWRSTRTHGQYGILASPKPNSSPDTQNPIPAR
jgi:hypothetical protein